MAGFLYYLPGATDGIGIKQVREAGLGYAFDSDRCTCSGVMANGPDATGQGVVAADPGRVGSIGLYPDKQTWRQIPGLGVWVGMDSDDRPRPEDLLRKLTLPGHAVELLDGNEWTCPIARSISETDGQLTWDYAVPRLSRLNDDGEFEAGGVVPQYAFLWDIACKFHDVRMGALEESDGKTVVFTFNRLHHKAVEALAANYVVGPAECDLLSLLTQEKAVEILDALIDEPARLELLKKITGAPDGSTTDGGPSVDTQDTDQQ